MDSQQSLFSRHIPTLLGVLFIAVGIAITVFLAQQRQDIRQRAQGTGTLTFVDAAGGQISQTASQNVRVKLQFTPQGGSSASPTPTPSPTPATGSPTATPTPTSAPVSGFPTGQFTDGRGDNATINATVGAPVSFSASGQAADGKTVSKIGIYRNFPSGYPLNPLDPSLENTSCTGQICTVSGTWTPTQDDVRFSPVHVFMNVIDNSGQGCVRGAGNIPICNLRGDVLRFVQVAAATPTPTPTQAGYVVSGTVRGESGSPVPGVTVQLCNNIFCTYGRSAFATTDASGNYSMDIAGLPGGPRFLVVTSHDASPPYLTVDHPGGGYDFVVRGY